jgi:hypothetical protein
VVRSRIGLADPGPFIMHSKSSMTEEWAQAAIRRCCSLVLPQVNTDATGRPRICATGEAGGRRRALRARAAAGAGRWQRLGRLEWG